MKQFIALLFAICMLNGCAMTSKQADLDVAMLQYEKGWRWNNLPVVLQFHKPASYAGVDMASYDKIRVGDYRVLGNRLLGDGRILQQVKMTYHAKDDVRMKNAVFELIWDYDKPSKRWYVDSSLPVIH